VYGQRLSLSSGFVQNGICFGGLGQKSHSRAFIGSAAICGAYASCAEVPALGFGSGYNLPFVSSLSFSPPGHYPMFDHFERWTAPWGLVDEIEKVVNHGGLTSANACLKCAPGQVHLKLCNQASAPARSCRMENTHRAYQCTTLYVFGHEMGHTS